MDTFTLWLETIAPPSADEPWSAWEDWYVKMEPLIMSSSLEELNTTGNLTVRGMVQRTGLSEGLSSFLVREFVKRHRNLGHEKIIHDREKAERHAENFDSYLYHVTTKRRLPLIRKNGLSPNAPSQFSNYEDYSRGKVFFCEKGGVKFWMGRVEDHEQHNHDKPSRVVVLRVARALLEDKLQNDGRGTEDSRKPSYYVTEKVPAKAVEVVK